jgi:UDP-N-acetyl-2-amino-2-deoxyglucuronate dehydrogenase
MTSFALLGAAGYVAPRHMRAMAEVGGRLEAACDPSDSVGIIDGWFPDAEFFTEAETFARHLEARRRQGRGIDQLAICSPNHLHEAHCRLALRAGADAICEKPLVLDPRHLDGLAEAEAATGRRISTILQLRLHPAVQALKQRLDSLGRNERMVDLAYITARGRWYHSSWKSDEAKSGGIVTNIGVHLFDLLIHLFGTPDKIVVHRRDRERAAGFLACGAAAIRWFLSIDRADLPEPGPAARAVHRSITVDGEPVDFSDGIADLHTLSYREILAGRGFGLEAARPSVELAAALRAAPIEPGRGDRHPRLAGVAS